MEKRFSWCCTSLLLSAACLCSLSGCAAGGTREGAPAATIETHDVRAIQTVTPSTMIVAMSYRVCTDKGCWWEMMRDWSSRSDSTKYVMETVRDQLATQLGMDSIPIYETDVGDQLPTQPAKFGDFVQQTGYQGHVVTLGFLLQERFGLGHSAGYVEVHLELRNAATNTVVFSGKQTRQKGTPILWIPHYTGPIGSGLNNCGREAIRSAILDLVADAKSRLVSARTGAALAGTAGW